MTERERDICARFRSLRHLRIRWSQSDLASQLGITRDQVASIEYGRTPLRYRVAINFCRTFDINAVWLATGKGEPMRFFPVLWSAEQRTQFSDTDLFSRVYDFCPQNFEPIHHNLVPEAPFIEPRPEFDARQWLAHAVISWFASYRFRSVKEAEVFARGVDFFARTTIREFQHSGGAIRIWPTAAKNPLTNVSVSGKQSGVKSPMAILLARLNKATAQRGMKSKLAKAMGVPLANISQWLSGERKPGGETTLRLLHWVEQQENP